MFNYWFTKVVLFAKIVINSLEAIENLTCIQVNFLTLGPGCEGVICDYCGSTVHPSIY